VSGGTFEPRACKIKIDNFVGSVSGNWTLFVLRNVLPSSANSSTMVVYSTHRPTLTMHPPGPMSLNANEDFNFTCRAENGRPTPIGFKWFLNDVQVLVGLGQLTMDTSVSDAYGNHPVSQSFTGNAGQNLRTHKLACYSVQELGDFGDSNFVQAVVDVAPAPSTR
jgi:hypothetical protein